MDDETYYENCLVGRFLTSSVVHFQAMRSTLANVWHPIGGVSIIDLENRRFLFRFYNTVDVDRVDRNGLWNFNSHLLMTHRLGKGDDLLNVSLTTVAYSMIVNDVPHGFMFEYVAKQLGNFIGTILEYNTSIIQMGYKGLMRI